MQGSSWSAQLAWVARHTPLTQRALANFPVHSDAELYICFHIDLKMIPVIAGLAEKIPLRVIACNQTTVDRQGWESLTGRTGVELLDKARAFDDLAITPGRRRFLCDLGGEMICCALDSPGSVLSALEGTTTGITRVRRHLGPRDAAFPIVDWNSAPLKLAVHNEKMVGFSVWQTFTEITRLSLHGKSVGVLGFGSVGRGIARTARHLGGAVSVFDPLPAARTLAAFEGFPTPGRDALLSGSDVLVTATGHPSALLGQDLERVKNGAFLLNSGHGCEEFAPEIRQHPGRHSVLDHVEEVRFGPALSRHCFLLARGELLNLAAGFGDTINGFDLTSAQLIQAIRFLLEATADLEPGWHSLPSDFMNAVF
jgi:adenosylhomocysteinase